MRTLKKGDRVEVQINPKEKFRGVLDEMGEGSWIYCDMDELGMQVYNTETTTVRKIDTRRDAYLRFFEETTKRMLEITRAKNEDYCGSLDDDPFANFTMVERAGICTTEQGFLVRLSDKFMRIASLTKTGKQKVKDESVEDTLLDAANYCLLFLGYLKQKKEEK